MLNEANDDILYTEYINLLLKAASEVSSSKENESLGWYDF